MANLSSILSMCQTSKTLQTLKMPQEFHVLQCFNCEMYQVDIVKKIPKWTCKMCGEKQSVQKIYDKGTGKECRLSVQSLNEQRLQQPKHVLDVEEAPFSPPESEHFYHMSGASKSVDCSLKEIQEPVLNIAKGHKRSKWSEFTEKSLEESEVCSKVTKIDVKTKQVTKTSGISNRVMSGKFSGDNIFENVENNDLDSIFTL